MPNELADALLDAPKADAAPETTEAAPEAASPEPKAEPKEEPVIEPETVEEPKAEAAKPEPAAKEDKSQEVDEIDSDLLMRAENELGLTEEQAKSIGSEGLLSMASALDRRFIALGQKKPEATEQPAPQPAPEVKPEPKEEPKGSFEIPKELLDGETVDPVVGTTLKALADHINGTQNQLLSAVTDAVGKVEQMVQSLARADQQNATRTFLDQFENAVTTLGPEWESVLGTEKYDALPSNSEYLNNRKAVLDTVEALVNGYATAGIDVRSIPMPVLVRRAANATFADKLETASRKKIASKLKEREGSMLPASSQRKGRGLSREEKARQSVRAVIDKSGAGTTDGNRMEDLLLG